MIYCLFVRMVGESLDSVNIVIAEPVYPDIASSGHLEMKVMLPHSARSYSRVLYWLYLS